MNNQISIQLKAAFLLLVFALNTIVGFACAVGLDMGFNSTHHHKETTGKIHVHKDGTKHEHKTAAHDHGFAKKSADDNCCKDKVAELSLSDKSVPQASIAINPLFLIVFTSLHYKLIVLFPPLVANDNKYFVRNYHPPIADIRIAIQSFQI